MTDRLQQITKFYHEALKLDESERASFLEACVQDEDVRKEVESLLANEGKAKDLLEAPALEMMAKIKAKEQPSLVEQQLGSYRIKCKIGSGGMGEVYQAKDQKLGRDVAIKVLPEEFARDQDRVARFQREAKLLASLNHPNIAAIYGLEESDGEHFLVLELVEGETLADRIKKSLIPVEEALKLALQISEALEAAHEKGVIHRDLKPANIKVTPDGKVKVLDFGLAKAIPRDHEGSDISDSPTLSATYTQKGLILGTASYMSPEQAQGQKVDKRTDIWAFGCVLYEMITGRVTFPGENVTDVLAAVIRAEPEWDCLPANLNWRIREALEGCLKKEAQDRFHDIADVRIDIKKILDDPYGVFAKRKTTEPRSRLQQTLPWIAAIAVIIIAGVAIWNMKPSIPTEHETILIAGFENFTGEGAFNTMLDDTLRAGLEESPFLKIYPEEGIRETLQFMELSPEESITSEFGREICRRRNIKAMVTGSISDLDGNYFISLQAVNVVTGDVIPGEPIEVESKVEVPAKLGEAVINFREKLEKFVPWIVDFDVQLLPVTTSSLEALEVYSLGMKQSYSGAIPIAALQEAVKLDPDFALAHSSLALFYQYVYASDRAIPHAREAFKMRDRVVSKRERHQIAATFYRAVTGEMPEAIGAASLWQQTCPQDEGPYLLLSDLFMEVGRYEDAINVLRESIRLNPNNSTSYGKLAISYFCLKQYEEAIGIINQARALQVPDHWAFSNTLFGIGFIQGDQALMQEQIDLAYQAMTLAFSGQLEKSRGLLDLVAERTKQENNISLAPIWRAARPAYSAYFGNCQDIHEDISAALEISTGWTHYDYPLRALSFCREIDQAKYHLDKVTERYPENTLLNELLKPTIEASIEIHRVNPNPEEAIRLLKPALLYENSPLGYAAKYIRGQAFLLLGKGEEAAREFQKMFKMGRQLPNEPLYSLAYLGMARAAALSGNMEESIKYYREFRDIMKDADDDLPVIIQARAEYAKLFSTENLQ